MNVKFSILVVFITDVELVRTISVEGSSGKGLCQDAQRSSQAGAWEW